MKKMSHEMMERAMHAKSAEELKAMMTMSATALDDSELDTITGGAGGNSGNKVGLWTSIWFIHKNEDGSLLYETGKISAVVEPGYAYWVSATAQSLNAAHFPLRVLDSEIYLYSNDL